MNRSTKMKNGVLAIGIVLWLCCGCPGAEAQNSFVKDDSKSRVGKLQQTYSIEAIKLGTGRNFKFKGVMNKNDLLEIDSLAARFFDVFTNTDGKIPNVRDLEDIFISQGTIINNTSGTPEVYSVQEFIASREKILGGGDLTDFSEREISHKTEISGNIAQRFCTYEKSGNLNGEFFETKGTKTIQFVKVNGVWKMSSVAWSDER